MKVNKNIFKLLFLVLILSLIVACDSKNDKVSKQISYCPNIDLISDGPPEPCDDRSNPLDIVGKTDTLKILIEASDCGEWGGHRESIYLQRNSDDKLCARFVKDTVPCDKIIEKDRFGVLDDKARVIVLDTTKMLNLNDEKLISLFLQRLLELYLKNDLQTNAGSIYEIINSDSSLKFTYWNSGDCKDTYYGKVRKQIFGEILKLK